MYAHSLPYMRVIYPLYPPYPTWGWCTQCMPSPTLHEAKYTSFTLLTLHEADIPIVHLILDCSLLWSRIPCMLHSLSAPSVLNGSFHRPPFLSHDVPIPFCHVNMMLTSTGVFPWLWISQTNTPTGRHVSCQRKNTNIHVYVKDDCTWSLKLCNGVENKK